MEVFNGFGSDPRQADWHGSASVSGSDADSDSDVGEYKSIKDLYRDLIKMCSFAETEMMKVGSMADGKYQSPQKKTDVSLVDGMNSLSLSCRKRCGSKTAEPEEVCTPSKRHCGKQSPVLCVRRNPKYCQHPECVYSRSEPGRPAWAPETTYCLWCDSDAMKEAARRPSALKYIRISLSVFEQRAPDIYEKAMAKLPANVVRTFKYCQKDGCVFNSQNPGEVARTLDGRYCMWCDSEKLAAMVESPAGAIRIRQSVSMFKEKAQAVYEAACGRLPDGFRIRNAHYCGAPGCVFSLYRPGEVAWAARGKQRCVWCDPSQLLQREQSREGLKKIAYSLSRFTKRMDLSVLVSAYQRLSPDFEFRPQRLARLKRENQGMRENDVVRRCGGRMVPRPSESLSDTGKCPAWLRRKEVKEFEVMTGRIESDDDWARICCTGYFYRMHGQYGIVDRHMFNGFPQFEERQTCVCVSCLQADVVPTFKWRFDSKPTRGWKCKCL